MKKLFVFLIQFLVFSLFFYGVWYILKGPYTAVLGWFFATISDLFSLPLRSTVNATSISITVVGSGGLSSPDMGIRIESIALIANMTTLMALVMATPLMSWRRKLFLLPFNAFLLFFYHAASLLVIMGAFGIPLHSTGGMRLLRTMCRILFSFSEQIGKIAIPFIIWLLFSHRVIFSHLTREPAIISAKRFSPSALTDARVSSEGETGDKEECPQQNTTIEG